MNATTRAALAMQGAGNAFLVLDERPPRFERYAELARVACAPHAGERFDGLLVIREHADALAEMRVYNADGSEAEMCGNGVRCVARYLAERGAGDRFQVMTQAGPIALAVISREPFLVRAELSEPIFPDDAREETIAAAGRTWSFVAVDTGNPHAVVFVDDPARVDVETAGAALSAHERFPLGCNVHFVAVIDAATLRVRHYERGAGVTLACGTGAVASVAAAIRTRGVRSPATVEVPGGTLVVDWRPGAGAALTGPAEIIGERPIGA